MRISKIGSSDQRSIKSAVQPVVVAPVSASPLRRLHLVMGNQTLGRFLQAKLKVNQPGDVYEQEADRAADQVMRMPDRDVRERATAFEPIPGPQIQRTCSACEEELHRHPMAGEAERKQEEEEEPLQAKELPGTTPEVSSDVEAYLSGIKGGGEPLPESARAFFEPRFDYDFSRVRVHVDTRAAESARAVNALAYTAGRDVVFGSGQYAPASAEGRRLLAHELAHVVQQSDRPPSITPRGEAMADPSQPDCGQVTPPAVAIQREATAPTCTPPPDSPYAGMQAGLRDKVCSSFRDRQNKVANADKNLDNAFWSSPAPADPWDALDRIGFAQVNTLAEVYERAAAAGGVWNYVNNIRNVWTTSSRGFTFHCTDFAAMASSLTSNASFCKDTATGQSMHQKPNAQDCWREVIAGSHGLHVCLDRAFTAGAQNGIHIDLHQTVDGKDANDVCDYNINIFGALGSHWWDIGLGWDPSIFERYQIARKDARRLREEFSVQSSDMDAVDQRLDQLVPSLKEQAVRGAKGEQQATQEKGKEMSEIESAIRKLYAKRFPPPPIMGPKI